MRNRIQNNWNSVYRIFIIFFGISVLIYLFNSTSYKIWKNTRQLSHKYSYKRCEAVRELSKLKDPRVVEPLIALLTSKDWDVRFEAAKILANTNDPRIRKHLIESLKNEYYRVRSIAAEALTKSGWEPKDDVEKVNLYIAEENWDKCVAIGEVSVAPLITRLRDNFPSIRAAAALSLGHLKDPRAVEPLIVLLKDKRFNRYGGYQVEAIDALLEINNPGLVDILISALNHEDQSMRKAAIKALGELKDPKAVDPLIPYLDNESIDIRRNTVKALGKLKDPRVTGLIIDLLDDKDFRSSAIVSLGDLEDPRATDSIITILQGKDHFSREESVVALGKIKDPKSIIPLAEILKGKDPYWVKEAAIEALGEFKNSRAVLPLIERLLDRSREGERYHGPAIGSIIKIGEPAAEPLIALLKTRFDSLKAEVFKDIIYTLIRIEGFKAEDVHVDYFIELLEGRGSLRAATVLGALKNPRASLPLINSLNDDNPNMRAIAARSLGEINDFMAITSLIKLLNDREPNVRHAAAISLGKLKASETIPQLISLIKTDTVPVIQALGEMGDEKAIPVLLPYLCNWDIGKEAALSLDKLGWQPETVKDRVHYEIAKRMIRSLRDAWTPAWKVLLIDLRSSDQAVIKNALYASILIGKESIIPDLIMALNRHGTKSMAEIFLNCGQKEVEDAAAEWCSRNGYDIYQINGSSNTLKWGGRRK